ncbi:hypothetical protein FACS189468_5910 [Spirochaetia bacterium]|nr:hypothetical protein FACS189468_5910 [Spirochaetia bacterium]
MRKFLFALLILMVGVFAVSAVPAHPPGGVPLEIAIFEGYGIAPPDTVLTMAPLSTDQGSVLAEAVITDFVFPARPQDVLGVSITNTGQAQGNIFVQPTGFYLLC